MLNKKTVIFFLIFFSIIFSDKKFNLISKTEDKISVGFKLENYLIDKVDGKDQIFLDDKSLSIEENILFNTFINIDSDQEYNIIFEQNSVNSYDFQNNSYSTNFSDPYYWTKEHFIRGRKVVELIINPFKFYNDFNKVDIIDDILINIELLDEYRKDERQLDKYSKSFDKLINNISLNEIDLNRDWEYQAPSILYICDPDVESNPYLQALINWRKQQGYEATLVTTNETGNSTYSIKSFIEEAYFEWDNPPEFLCLVGDANGDVSIPTYDVVQEGGGGWDPAHGESDYPYTLIEGGNDDLFPEMFVGRISVRSSTELSTVANKIIGYEKAYAGTEDWLTTTALVGDPYDSGISTVITNQYIEQIMDNYGVENINTQYSGSSFDAFMRNQINAGISFLNYRGFYGFSNFNHNDVNQLNNGYKLPFICTLTCGVNNFWSDTESVVEALLRAGSTVNPSGAVAVVGTSQSYTHTAFNNIVAMGIFEGIYVHNAYTAGEALVYGKTALMDTYPQNPNGNVTLFSSWNNLMGDPLTHLWTNTPIYLISEHESIISSGTNYFEVSISDDEGRPVENAIVTLYKNDEHSITSTTNSFGQASFNLDFEEIGNVFVTSRCHNCVPYETSFEISNDIPNISLIEGSISVGDDLNGNQDGIANPGETVNLNFNIHNSSEDIMSDCVVEVNSNYSEIQIINNFYNIDNLYSNSVVTISDISIHIDNMFNYLENTFLLNASLACQDLSWNFILPIIVNYGDLSINLDLISDQNNNMILDPGETAEYRVTINNNGYIDLSNLDMNFNYETDEIQISGAQLFINQINMNDYNDINSIAITASNNLINGTIVSIPISSSSNNGYESTLYTNIQVGNTLSTDPLGPDSHGYYIYDSSDIAYQWAPGYDWIEIDPDYGGDGSQISVYDSGNNQDDSETLELPFTFTFYGIDYDVITVCSNGWISFGETDMTSFRNYNLPGAGGPSPMIAAFWDDLKTSNGGEIYYYYDPLEDYVIIEWSDMRTYTNNDIETFQVILYNSGDLTPTGDDEIKVQYKDFNNTSEGYYPVGNYDGAVIHGQYSTIGIENIYGNVGLEYTFNDEYASAASILNDETAIFITTRAPLIYSQPSLEVSDSDYYIDLNPGELENLNLTISNNGQEGSVLNYDLVLSPFNQINTPVDNGGYGWISSLDESSNLEYRWEDVSENAISLSFNQNDEATEFLDIGFSFPFYDSYYTQCIINPNGWIGFSEDFNGWNNQNLLSEDSPRNAILAFWDDLNPGASQDNDIGSGDVFFDSQPDKCIIWYDNVVHWTSLDRVYDFQIVLYPDGEINLNYREMIGDTDSATIGIVNYNGEISNQVIYNNEFVEDESSILFKGKPIWLNYYQNDSNDTSLGYNESNQYSIDINTENLFSGEYSCAFIVNPENIFPQIIPVYLNVLDSDLLPGDVNFDNEINVLDIVGIMAYIIESSQPTAEQFEAADVNQDGALDVLDIVTLVNIILDE